MYVMTFLFSVAKRRVSTVGMTNWRVLQIRITKEFLLVVFFSVQTIVKCRYASFFLSIFIVKPGIEIRRRFPYLPILL